MSKLSDKSINTLSYFSILRDLFTSVYLVIVEINRIGSFPAYSENIIIKSCFPGSFFRFRGTEWFRYYLEFEA